MLDLALYRVMTREVVRRTDEYSCDDIHRASIILAHESFTGLLLSFMCALKAWYSPEQLRKLVLRLVTMNASRAAKAAILKDAFCKVYCEKYGGCSVSTKHWEELGMKSSILETVVELDPPLLLHVLQTMPLLPFGHLMENKPCFLTKRLRQKWTDVWSEAMALNDQMATARLVGSMLDVTSDELQLWAMNAAAARKFAIAQACVRDARYSTLEEDRTMPNALGLQLQGMVPSALDKFPLAYAPQVYAVYKGDVATLKATFLPKDSELAARFITTLPENMMLSSGASLGVAVPESYGEWEEVLSYELTQETANLLLVHLTSKVWDVTFDLCHKRFLKCLVSQHHAQCSYRNYAALRFAIVRGNVVAVETLLTMDHSAEAIAAAKSVVPIAALGGNMGTALTILRCPKTQLSFSAYDNLFFWCAVKFNLNSYELKYYFSTKDDVVAKVIAAASASASASWPGKASGDASASAPASAARTV